MVTQRPISPFESGYFQEHATFGSVPVGGMALFIGSTVEGEFDTELLRTVLAELAAEHPLLSCRRFDDAGVPVLRHVEGYRPAITESPGGDIEYVDFVNQPQPWDEGLFFARVFREDDRTRIVLVVHHGITDGRSSFALLDEMWRRYTAHRRGAPLPVRANHELPQAVDERLAALVSGAEVDELLAAMRTIIGEPPAGLPRDGTAGSGRGLFVAERIELEPEVTAAFAAAARSAGIGVNALLSGCALAAVRAELGGVGTLPMVCGYAADMRAAVDPWLPDETVLNCASGWGTLLAVAESADPFELGRVVHADVRAALERRDPARLALAGRYIRDEGTARILAEQPSIALSNIGRVPDHIVPEGVRLVRDSLLAMGPGMPPKLTAFTLGERLTVQVEYDTNDHSRAQMGRVRRNLAELLHRTAGRAGTLSADGAAASSAGRAAASSVGRAGTSSADGSVPVSGDGSVSPSGGDAERADAGVASKFTWWRRR
ncbi:phthiocerol/phthiodiolone dimycocerosyl transferase family protein [Nocardia nova]|jgi:hypothetical protein|uniref:phthiocerol/phthiodiolone dimycocerosyl transferase family protein n=1 Tax=Nocardia nova TaxID=37330 RepID=UPI0018954339|nr:hypothetical protein [Nocardia nova]MBF6149788.1 hypothetical protein [Nocardia nova]